MSANCMGLVGGTPKQLKISHTHTRGKVKTFNSDTDANTNVSKPESKVKF